MFALRAGGPTAQLGLTLLEFLFALSVISVTLLGVAGMFPSALRTVVGGGQVTKATILAQAMADMIRNDPFDSVVARYNGFDTRNLRITCPVDVTGFDADYNKKKWACELLATDAQDSGRGLPAGYGTVSVGCQNANGTNEACSNTDLRRVTVTVVWDRAGLRSVSLVTYVARTE